MAEQVRSSTKEVVYGPLHEMVHLQCDAPGFDMRDEYAALWELHQRDLTGVEVQSFFSERMYANLLTYAIEKDAVDYARTYVLIPDGENRWKLTTEDHREFACLSEMAAEAVKKAEAEGRDAAYDQAIYEGVVKLKQWLLVAGVDDRIGLIYPPIPDSPQSMLYSYTVINKAPEAVEIFVEGSAVPLNLAGANKLYSWLHRSNESEHTTNYLVSTPFLTDTTHEAMAKKAVNLCFSEAYSTGADLSNKFSSDELAAVYYEQISEAADFLTDCIRQEYTGRALTQAGLDRLELAFSFARRAILTARKHAHDTVDEQVVTADTLHKLYWKKIRLDAGGYFSEMDVDDFNYQLEHIFGSIGYTVDIATGCPGAGLAGLGVQGSGMQNGTSISIEQGYCPEIQCRRCQNKDISETDTECRKCGWKPGDPVEVRAKTNDEKTNAHYQNQVQRERLKDIKINKKEKIKKKNTSLWAVLFGLTG